MQDKSQYIGRKSTVCLYWQSTDEQLGHNKVIPELLLSHNTSETTSTTVTTVTKKKKKQKEKKYIYLFKHYVIHTYRP